MKPEQHSPRDWLLARHTAARPKLDALRAAALAPRPLTWRHLPGELFRPNQRAWLALAAVWAVLAVVEFYRPTPPLNPNRPARETVALWLTQLKSHESLTQISRHP